MGKSPSTPILGHVHSQPPNAHTSPCHMTETNHPPPSMVDNLGSIPPPNARLHAPLTTTERKSKGRDPPKYAPHLHLQETHSTSTDLRSDHRYHRDGTTRPPPRKLKRGHEPPQIYSRTTIQWQTCQTIRTRPNGLVFLMQSPRLVHSHRMGVQSTQKKSLDQPS